MGMVTLLFSYIAFCIVGAARNERALASFSEHADELRSRATAAPMGSAERASLEAEAADVESAAQDWPQIANDEGILAAPLDGCGRPERTVCTSVKGPHYVRHEKAEVTYSAERKLEASNERTALLSKHGEHVFDGAREAAGCHFCTDGWWVPLLIAAVGFSLAVFMANTPCASPIDGVFCQNKSAATYTCTIDPTSASCISTPIGA